MSIEEYKQKAKTTVLDRIGANGSGNQYIDCLCGKYKKTEQKFRVDGSTGKWECFSGKCQLEHTSKFPQNGDCHDLLKPLGIEIQSNGSTNGYNPLSKYEAHWIYRDEIGSPKIAIGKKLDPNGKKKYHTFFHNGSEWIFSSDYTGTKPIIPYNLDKFKNSHTIFIVEGEKCSDTLSGILPEGMIATTNIGGAEKWNTGLNKFLEGKIIVVIPDHDFPNEETGKRKGWEHAQKIMHSLKNHKEPIALIPPQEIGIIEGEDIHDWIVDGSKNWKVDLEPIVTKHLKIAKRSHSGNLFGADDVKTDKKRVREISEKSSERGSRERFIELFGENTIHVPQKGKEGTWYIWNGTIWEEDRKSKLYEYADSIGDEVWKEIEASKDSFEIAELLKHWKSLLKHKNIKSLLNSASELVNTHITEIDSQPEIIALNNCYLDLSTNGIDTIEPDRKYLITRKLDIDYDPSAPCHKWNEYLERSQPDPKIRLLIQKIAGSFLTGLVPFEKIFFFYGNKAGNGKSVFVSTMFEILGDYAKKSSGSIVDSNLRQSMDDLASLKGARLVVSPEIESGSVLNSATLKDVSGGEPIRAEYKFQDSFNFKPQFTFLMYGNHKPTLRATDEGIKRRLILIPWKRQFRDTDEDYVDRETLMRSFREEKAGILQWMIDGLYLLKGDGWKFNEPDSIRNETNHYFEDEDRIGDFINECLEEDPSWTTAMRNSKQIYEAYQLWCQENGMKSMNSKNFKREMESHDIELFHDGTHTRAFRNIKLNSEWEGKLHGIK